MEASFKFRTRLICFFLFFLALILITRLFFIQVVKGGYYQDLANKQYFAPGGDNFDRGTIYFKTKDGQLISAATVKMGFQAAINPKILENPEEVYAKLSEIISLDKEDFLKRCEKKDDPYEVVAHRLDEETAEKIKDLKVRGLDVYPESWRYYPADNLASRVLGFVGYQGDELGGRYGLERYYDSVLANENKNNFINSFAEILTDVKEAISGETEEKGDIVLTIEPNVQSLLEKNLEKVVQKYQAEFGGGIIIEPKTGRILALAVKPDFNPNSYGENKDLNIFMNPLVEGVFEMGSIMKPLTIAAALNEGKITPETSYYDNGFVEVEGEKIENYDGQARGRVNIQAVLNNSINTGAIFVMRQMGKEEFGLYLKNYGLGEKTGIDLPAEVEGKLSNVIKSPREIEYATASFGQGFAVTPIEMTIALSSLANGGYLMKPYLVEEIKLKGSKDKVIKPQVKREVLKRETTEKVSRMLAKTFDEALVGGVYKMEHYSIATKTGTAQLIKEGEKGYQKGASVHTFFGYAPAFDARFLTLLILVRPQGVQYAAFSLSEPFVNITKFLLNYYEVPPDR